NALEFNSNDKNTKWVETTKNIPVALKNIKKIIKIIIKMVPKNTKKNIKRDQVQGNALVHHHHRKQQDYNSFQTDFMKELGFRPQKEVKWCSVDGNSTGLRLKISLLLSFPATFLEISNILK
ncbi:unnamed protein product, partial [Trichobilharzia szidati]